MAKLFVQDPEIILLDEPNNHLDIRYQQELIQQLNEWSAQEGKTLIGVFHDIRLALTLSEKIVFMKQGKVAAQGDFQTLASKEFLQTILKQILSPIFRNNIKFGKLFNNFDKFLETGKIKAKKQKHNGVF